MHLRFALRATARCDCFTDRREVMIGSPAKTSQGMKLVHPFRCQPLSIPSARILSLLSFSPSLFSFLSAQVPFIAFLSLLILLSFSYYCLLLLSVFDSSTKWDEVVGMYSRDLILRFSPIIGHSIFIRIITGIIMPINANVATRIDVPVSLSCRGRRDIIYITIDRVSVWCFVHISNATRGN